MELKIEEILKNKGLRMADLAAKLNLDQSNLTKSLEGNPKLSRLKDVAAALDVSVRDLFPEEAPSLKAGVLKIGDRHFALVPVDVPENPNNFNSTQFFRAVEAFILRCLDTHGSISFCGMYEGCYPFGLVYDAKSRKLFLSFSSGGDDFYTWVYDPQADSFAKNCTPHEDVANYIARNIMNSIQDVL